MRSHERGPQSIDEQLGQQVLLSEVLEVQTGFHLALQVPQNSAQLLHDGKSDQRAEDLLLKVQVLLQVKNNEGGIILFEAGAHSVQVWNDSRRFELPCTYDHYTGRLPEMLGSTAS